MQISLSQLKVQYQVGEIMQAESHVRCFRRAEELTMMVTVPTASEPAFLDLTENGVLRCRRIVSRICSCRRALDRCSCAT